MSGEITGVRSLWRQPLFHFLLAGAAIFALNTLRGPAENASARRIVITVAQVERLAGFWQKTWGRAPSETELQALVRDHIKEEIYYREALSLGLDVNDTVIRRRLRQKMEFLTTDDVVAPAADDPALQTYFERNADAYRQSPVFDFAQVYSSATSDGDVQQALAALRAGANPENLGEPISLPETMSRADESEIARIFGAAFYEELNKLEPGHWSGPVESGFGWHLVKITNKEAERVPPFEDIRTRVENDWLAEHGIAARNAAYAKLRERYDVEIEAATE